MQHKSDLDGNSHYVTATITNGQMDVQAFRQRHQTLTSNLVRLALLLLGNNFSLHDRVMEFVFV